MSEKIRIATGEKAEEVLAHGEPINWDDYEMDLDNKAWIESWEKKLVKEVEEDINRYEDMYWGQLMTLIDATFSDPIQRKAFKDSVKNIKNGLIDMEPQIIPAIHHIMYELAHGVHKPKIK